MASFDDETISYGAQSPAQQAEDDVAADDSQETADVKRWHKRIKDARDFDKEAHRGYARDRTYLSGTKPKFKVIVPIAQTYVGILNSFLYTKNPSVEVDPTAMTEPPPQKEILAKAIEQVLAKRQQQAQGIQQYAQLGKALTANMPPEQLAALAQHGQQLLQQQGAGQTGFPIPPPPGSGDATQLKPPQDVPDNDPEVQQVVDQVMTPYRQKRDDATQFADTLEILIQKTWDQADLKRRGKRIVNSAVSIGIGWMKAAWFERKGQDPTMQRRLNDLLEQAAELQANREQIEKGDKTSEELDARRAELEQQIAGIEAMDEVVLERGFLMENVPAQDIQVSTEIACLADYKDAEWICHFTYPTLERAKADMPDIADKLDKANKYYPVKPCGRRSSSNTTYEAQFSEDKEIRAADAEFFRSADAPGNRETQASSCCVQVKEIWDRISGNVITLVDGLNLYAKQPYVPDVKSTRGIPFFQYAIGYVDGERHPVSYISRSDTIIDEYNDTRTKYRTVRRRSVPKTVYQRSQLEAEEAKKLARADVGEMVGIDTTNPDQPLNQIMMPVSYAGVDPALYDTQVIVNELERVWGIAEALQAASQGPNPTATQSELQNTGTQTVIGDRRDDLDDMLSDLAQYSAEVLLQVLTEDDAIEMAGPWAFWPTGLSIQDMQVMTSVKVSAGSSGRPATALQQQAWAAILPQMKAAIEQIGALRGSQPDEVADCVEQLVIETVRRTGDRIDPTRFIPDPPRQPPPPKPVPQPPLQDSALNGTQIQALTQILTDVRGRVIAAPAAIALIQAVAPKVPLPIVQEMVKGSVPLPGDPPTEIKSKNVQTRSPESHNPSEANPNPPPVPPLSPAAAQPNGASAPPAANGVIHP